MSDTNSSRRSPSRNAKYTEIKEKTAEFFETNHIRTVTEKDQYNARQEDHSNRFPMVLKKKYPTEWENFRQLSGGTDDKAVQNMYRIVQKMLVGYKKNVTPERSLSPSDSLPEAEPLSRVASEEYVVPIQNTVDTATQTPEPAMTSSFAPAMTALLNREMEPVRQTVAELSDIVRKNNQLDVELSSRLLINVITRAVQTINDMQEGQAFRIQCAMETLASSMGECIDQNTQRYIDETAQKTANLTNSIIDHTTAMDTFVENTRAQLYKLQEEIVSTLDTKIHDIQHATPQIQIRIVTEEESAPRSSAFRIMILLAMIVAMGYFVLYDTIK
jgi:hypothetical protein